MLIFIRTRSRTSRGGLSTRKAGSNAICAGGGLVLELMLETVREIGPMQHLLRISHGQET